MNVFLLYKKEDFELQQELSWNEQALTQDLELKTLFDAMALKDDFLFEMVRKVILCSTNIETETILYRQEILKDCLKNPKIIQEIYKLASETLDKTKKNWWGIFSNFPNSVLYRSVRDLEMFLEMLKKLRGIADKHAGKFNSAGFIRLFTMLQKELNDDYFQELQEHLSRLKFREGVLMSAQLGKGNKGTKYVLRKLESSNISWWQKTIQYLFPNYYEKRQKGVAYDTNGAVSSFTFFINSRDEGGVRSLGELKNIGINLVANALAQSDDHILSFFNSLRAELAFYMGCLNLHDELISLKEPVSFPEPVNGKRHVLVFSELYDACLALSKKQKVTGNDINADGKSLVIITGANQGGKTTFLRSIGLAQLMMQSGMFVAAQSFKANVCDSVITHFRREEDSSMKSGKLEEELVRMNQIIEKITPNAIILFNESFAATNEREGSEIARQIVSALIEYGFKVLFVTHLYEFAFNYYSQKMSNALFIRAERQVNDIRSFRLNEGKPLNTSYGGDLYEEVFNENKNHQKETVKTDKD